MNPRLLPVLALLLGSLSLLAVSCGGSDAPGGDEQAADRPLTQEEALSKARDLVQEASIRLDDLLMRGWMQGLPFRDRMQAVRTSLGRHAAFIDGPIAHVQQARTFHTLAQDTHDLVFDTNRALGRLWTLAPAFEQLNLQAGILHGWFDVLRLPEGTEFEPRLRWRSIFLPRSDEAFRNLSSGLSALETSGKHAQLQAAEGLAREALRSGREIQASIEPHVKVLGRTFKRIQSLEGLAAWFADYEQQIIDKGSSERLMTMGGELRTAAQLLPVAYEDIVVQRVAGKTSEADTAMKSLTAALDQIETAASFTEVTAIARRIGVPPPPPTR